MVTLREAVNSDLGVIVDETTKEITTTGNLNTLSINTGQGDNEVYGMDQGVKTTDSPEFTSLTINGVSLSNTSGTNTGDQNLSTLSLKSNVLELDNTIAFTPDSDYEPATKKYVDELSNENSLTFAYGDATPEVIFTCGTDDVILSVELAIITPFNGVGATLSVGDVGVNDRLMSIAENMSNISGTYITTPLHNYSAVTTVALYITPGAGASAGNGFIKIFIK